MANPGAGSDTLQQHFFSTYVSLRWGMVGLAYAFPPLLWAWGAFVGVPCLQDSMSAYYHASEKTRVLFVGFLFAIGAALYLYKGYTKKENIALNIAGFLALCIAYFPMDWGPEHQACVTTGVESKHDFSPSLHGICAVAFFVCIGYVCWARAKDTLKLISDPVRRARFKRDYRICASVMVASPIIAYVIGALIRSQYSLTFFIEAVGVFAFATYWWRKTDEMAESRAEFLAAEGASQALTEIWEQGGSTD